MKFRRKTGFCKSDTVTEGGYDLKKVAKFFRSRFFLAAFCIVLEFVQLLAVFMLLYEYFLPITVLAWVFYIGSVLYLINREEMPESKIPWLIILLLLPVLGAFVFMLLSSNDTSRKEYDRYIRAEEMLRPFQKQTAAIEQLKTQDIDAYAQARYLCRAAKMPCYAGIKTTYFPIGEKFHAALLADLQTAEKFILMEYFIVQEGVMWNPIHEILKEKAALGVQVYFLYDDFGCIAVLPERYYEQLESEGIHCAPANKFKPILSHIHNNRDHRKITVIDGKIGFTGGINLADEYINAVEKNGHWKDAAIRLEGAAVNNLTALFIKGWNMQGKDPIHPDDFMMIASGNTEKGCVTIPFGDGPIPLYEDSIGENVYLNMIHGARQYLYITTPYLICDHTLLDALCMAAKKGVDVRIITPHIPDKRLVLLMTRSNYRKLALAGVKIFEYTPGFIHAKSFVCDDKFAVCGTINLDYRSLVHHFECGVWMYASDVITDMKNDFLQTQELSEYILPQDAALKFRYRILAEVLKVFSPLL